MHRRHRGRVQRDVGAQRLQHVGAARAGRDATPAVLGDARAGRRRDEHGGRRNVERVRGVAARAAQVNQVRAVGGLHLGRELSHDLRRCGDLADSLLLDAQAHRQRSDLHRREFAAHQPSPQDSISSWKISRCSMHRTRASVGVIGIASSSRKVYASLRDARPFARSNRAPGFGRPGAMAQQRYQAKDVHHRGASRKLLSIAWPCSVAMDSGWNCTPSTGSVLWRRPMISPSTVQAVTSRQSGSEARSTASEW